ncbi:NUDIX hydrolase [Rothia nasimurium]|uniref:NUDIX hydrolase n=1 Tax=Rothia nasimurium TaxID=85336 RepID=UPI001F16376D|nr:NUDIX hydrolase [Rothia nasimurium]
MDSKWSQGSPKSIQLDWQAIFIDPDNSSWQIEEAIRTDGGWSRKNFRFKQNIRESGGNRADGAVCLTVRKSDNSVLFIRQHRPAPGVKLLELPRGKAEKEDLDFIQVAFRETLEETGYRIRNCINLGNIFPDSGIQAASIAVIIAEFDDKFQNKEIVDGETIGNIWIPTSKIKEYIAKGEIRDAITLSAIQLWESYTSLISSN